MVDFTVLQNASEDSRVNSVVALGQLYQRLAAAAPLQRMIAPIPTRPTITPAPGPNITPAPRPIEMPMPVTPDFMPASPQGSLKTRSLPPQVSRGPTEKKSPRSALALFRRPKSDPAVTTSATSPDSLVPPYLLPMILADKSDSGSLIKELEVKLQDSGRQSMCSTEISSDASSSVFGPNDLWQNPWESRDGLAKETAVQAPLQLSATRRRIPTSNLEVASVSSNAPSLTPRITLPCEENKFAGFCKASSSHAQAVACPHPDPRVFWLTQHPAGRLEASIRHQESRHPMPTTGRHVHFQPVLALSKMHVRGAHDGGQGYQAQDLRHKRLQLRRHPLAVGVSVQIARLLEGRPPRSADLDVRLHLLLRLGTRDAHLWRRAESDGPSAATSRGAADG